MWNPHLRKMSTSLNEPRSLVVSERLVLNTWHASFGKVNIPALSKEHILQVFCTCTRLCMSNLTTLVHLWLEEHFCYNSRSNHSLSFLCIATSTPANPPRFSTLFLQTVTRVSPAEVVLCHVLLTPNLSLKNSITIHFHIRLHVLC